MIQNALQLFMKIKKSNLEMGLLNYYKNNQ